MAFLLLFFSFFSHQKNIMLHARLFLWILYPYIKPPHFFQTVIAYAFDWYFFCMEIMNTSRNFQRNLFRWNDGELMVKYRVFFFSLVFFFFVSLLFIEFKLCEYTYKTNKFDIFTFWNMLRNKLVSFFCCCLCSVLYSTANAIATSIQ